MTSNRTRIPLTVSSHSSTTEDFGQPSSVQQPQSRITDIRRYRLLQVYQRAQVIAHALAAGSVNGKYNVSFVDSVHLSSFPWTLWNLFRFHFPSSSRISRRFPRVSQSSSSYHFIISCLQWSNLGRKLLRSKATHRGKSATFFTNGRMCLTEGDCCKFQALLGVGRLSLHIIASTRLKNIVGT